MTGLGPLENQRPDRRSLLSHCKRTENRSRTSPIPEGQLAVWRVPCRPA